MDNLVTDLFQIMEERYEADLTQTPDYQDCRKRCNRLMEQIRRQMNSDFHDKLLDALGEQAQLETEAAFCWGLRLGLELHKL